MAVITQASAGTKEAAVARAERSFFEAKARFTKNATDPQAAWQFAQAAFDWADVVTSNTRRADLAEQGIAASRQALELDPKLAPSHYYLAMNLGMLASTKTLGALKLLGEMEAEFKAAIALDPNLDYAGPHRSLGLLYRDAPGWPTSLGNRGHARFHLRKAVEMSPDYPDNRLSLLDAYLKWGEKSAAQAELAATEQALKRARKLLTGDKWEWAWEEWERQWQKIKSHAADSSNTPESPSHRK